MVPGEIHNNDRQTLYYYNHNISPTSTERRANEFRGDDTKDHQLKEERYEFNLIHHRCETWKLTRIRWTERVSRSEEVWGWTKQLPLCMKLEEDVAKWLVIRCGCQTKASHSQDGRWTGILSAKDQREDHMELGGQSGKILIRSERTWTKMKKNSPDGDRWKGFIRTLYPEPGWKRLEMNE